MSRKNNRDHAKRQQRPMMEDKAIAEELEVLLSDAIAYRFLNKLYQRDF